MGRTVVDRCASSWFLYYAISFYPRWKRLWKFRRCNLRHSLLYFLLRNTLRYASLLIMSLSIDECSHFIIIFSTVSSFPFFFFQESKTEINIFVIINNSS